MADDQLWPAAVDATAENPSLSWMQALEPVGLADDVLKLKLREDASHLRAFVQSKQEQLERLLGRLAGRRIRIALEATETPAAAQPRRPRRGMSQDQREDVMKLPLVRQIAELFDAVPIDVKEDEGEQP